jgi:hypothetical protein
MRVRFNLCGISGMRLVVHVEYWHCVFKDRETLRCFPPIFQQDSVACWGWDCCAWIYDIYLTFCHRVWVCGCSITDLTCRSVFPNVCVSTGYYAVVRNTSKARAVAAAVLTLYWRVEGREEPVVTFGSVCFTRWCPGWDTGSVLNRLFPTCAAYAIEPYIRLLRRFCCYGRSNT